MRINRLFLVMLIGVFCLPACVSKRKFTEMEAMKLRAENRIRELTDENEVQTKRIAQMIADYEKMKLELLENNAQKDQKITVLNGQINALSVNVKEKDATIDEKLYAFEFEKRQLEEELEKSRAAQASFQSRNSAITEELSRTKDLVQNLQFDVARQKEEATRINEQMKLKDGKFEEQTSRLAALQAEIKKLQAQGQEKDETIERLSNNVKLLKNELGKN